MFVLSIRGEGEIVARGVEWHGEMSDDKARMGVERVVGQVGGCVEVEPAHGGVSVGGEVECAVGGEERKHFVTLRVDVGTKIFRCVPRVFRFFSASPDVFSSIASRGICHEVEKAVGSQGRVGNGKAAVRKDSD